jgi:hypothetical protein
MDIDVNRPRGIDASPSAGLTSNVLPEAQNGSSVESSHTGVSTNNVPLRTVQREGLKNNKTPQWFALRTTYGREKKAYDYLAAKEDIEVFHKEGQKMISIGRFDQPEETTTIVKLLPPDDTAYFTGKIITTDRVLYLY